MSRSILTFPTLVMNSKNRVKYVRCFALIDKIWSREKLVSLSDCPFGLLLTVCFLWRKGRKHSFAEKTPDKLLVFISA